MPPSEMMIGGLAAPSAWAAVKMNTFLRASASAGINNPQSVLGRFAAPDGRALRGCSCLGHPWFAERLVQNGQHVARGLALDPVPDHLAVSPTGDQPVAAQER